MYNNTMKKCIYFIYPCIHLFYLQQHFLSSRVELKPLCKSIQIQIVNYTSKYVPFLSVSSCVIICHIKR